MKRKLAGELLKVVRSVGQHTSSEETFEEGSHTVPSEPYFWETSHKSAVLKEVMVIDWKKSLLTESRLPNGEHEYLLDEIPIAVDTDGWCYLTMDEEKQTKSWKCNGTCKHRRSQARAYPGSCPGITHLCPSISKLSGFLGITKQAHILNIHALLYLTYNNFMVPML